MNREITAIEFFVLLLLAVALCLHFISANAQEITKRDLFLDDVRTANMAEPHDPIKCAKVREHGKTRICITETELAQVKK